MGGGFEQQPGAGSPFDRSAECTAEDGLLEWADHHVADMSERTALVHEDDRPKRGMGGVSRQALQQRNVRRDRAAASTKDEVAREIVEARQGGVTGAEVGDIVARKQLEGDIEMRYGIELTDAAAKGHAQKHWSTDDLGQIDGALAEIPVHHLRALGAIHRADKSSSEKAGGMFDNQSGNLEIFDQATLNGPNAGIGSPLSGRMGNRRGARNNRVTSVADVFQHEIGHAAAKADPRAYQKFIQAAGWKKIGDKDLEGLSAQDRGHLASERKQRDAAIAGKPTAHDHGVAERPITKDGQIYQVDRYDGGYLARDQDAIPAGSGWDYASSAPQEHFAEVYAKALQIPETLHEEMIAGPKRAYEQAAAQLNTKQMNRLFGGLFGMDAPTTADGDLKAAEAEVARLRHMAESRQAQWNVMRQDVFGVTDAEVNRQAKMLAESGASKDDVKDFRDRAAMAMTPKQLERLAAEKAPSR
jgi:hypothetical protein